jgi:hypothetical protein
MSVAELGVSQVGRQTYIISEVRKQKHSTFVNLKVNIDMSFLSMKSMRISA